MLSKLRTRLTYANVMATVAVFVALGGSSYAAIQVTGKNVKNSSLTGTDIKNSSLTTSDMKNGSLLAGDFKSGQLPAGPQGPQGAQGVPGFPGADGARGPSFGDVGSPSGAIPATGCTTVTLISEPVTVDTPSRVFATGIGDHQPGTSEHNPQYSLVLRDGSSDVARLLPPGESKGESGSVTGMLSTIGSPSVAYVADPGSYTLELKMGTSNVCTGTSSGVGRHLSYILVGNG